jgi:RNA polymerase sigma-70 factor (ECF subfamily)
MVNNRTDAEDLTQEAFLQVFRKIHTFRAESKFSTWLHRLTVNIALMRLRVRSLVDYSVEEMSEQSEETERSLKAFGVCDLSLSGVVDRLSLQRAVDQLAPGYKKVFILHDVEGYGHSEVAKLLGYSTGNSKSQLFKARLRLRELLKEEFRNAEPQRRHGGQRQTKRSEPTCAQ